jgi:cytochrome P450
MVFDEGLRLYPTGWIQPREALEDDAIQGFAVPRGTVIVLFQYLTHRHPDFWEDPDAFVPERFTPERIAAQHRFAHIPFGAGPHTCIGQPMALIGGPLALAALAQRFRVELPSDRLPRPSGTFFVRPAEPIQVVLYPREDMNQRRGKRPVVDSDRP